LLNALGVGSAERTWKFTEMGRGAVRNIKGITLFEGKRRNEEENVRGQGRRG
jgi:hypothetical protein